MGKRVKLCGVVLVLLLLVSVSYCREAAAWGNNTSTVMPNTGGGGNSMSTVATSVGSDTDTSMQPVQETYTLPVGQKPTEADYSAAIQILTRNSQDSEWNGPIKADISRDIIKLDSWFPSNRVEAVTSLGKSNNPEAVPYLVEVLKNDWSADVRCATVYSLANFKSDSRIVEPLITALKEDPDAEVRDTVVWALHTTDNSRIIEPLITASKEDSDANVRWSAQLYSGSLLKSSSQIPK